MTTYDANDQAHDTAGRFTAQPQGTPEPSTHLPASELPAPPTTSVTGEGTLITGSQYKENSTPAFIGQQVIGTIRRAQKSGELSDILRYRIGSANGLTPHVSVAIIVPFNEQELVMEPADDGSDDGQWTELAAETRAVVEQILGAHNLVEVDVDEQKTAAFDTQVTFVVGP
jgi:hypothetical protein